jgi:hypothetical protein
MKYINDYCDYDDDVAVSGSDNHFKSLSRMSIMSMMAACYYYRGVCCYPFLGSPQKNEKNTKKYT